jgi:hypothetical protein
MYRETGRGRGEEEREVSVLLFSASRYAPTDVEMRQTTCPSSGRSAALPGS